MTLKSSRSSKAIRMFLLLALVGLPLVQHCLAGQMYFGIGHACFILNGEVRCIGSNSNGQLGLGSNIAQVGVRAFKRSIDASPSYGSGYDIVSAISDPNTLQKVDLGPGEVAVHVSCFDRTTCVALLSNRVVCFGSNDIIQTNDLDGTLGLNDTSPAEVGKLTSDMGANLRSVVGIPITHPILELGISSAKTAQAVYTWGNHRGFKFSDSANGGSANVTSVLLPMLSSLVTFCVRMDYILNSLALNITKLQQVYCTADRETRTTAIGGTHSEMIVNSATGSAALYSWTWKTGYNFSKVEYSGGFAGSSLVYALTTDGNVMQASFSTTSQRSDSEWTLLSFPSSVVDVSTNCVLLDNRRDIQCVGGSVPALTIALTGTSVSSSAGLNLTIPNGKQADRIYAMNTGTVQYVCAELEGGGFWCMDTVDTSGKDAALVAIVIGLPIAVLGFCGFCGWRIRNGRYVRKLRVRRALRRKQRQYVTFISHHKKDAGEVANTLWAFFNKEFGSKSFLDVSDLEKLTEIRQSVRDSLVLVVCQTKEYLFRPWCLVELYEAILCDIPVVPILLENQGYNYEGAMQFLRSPNFANELDQRNPGALQELRKQGIDVDDMARRISNTLPYLLSRPYNSSASLQVRTAQLHNIQSLVLDKILGRETKGSLEIVQVEQQADDGGFQEKNAALGRFSSHLGRGKFAVGDEDELVQLIEKRLGFDQKFTSLESRMSTLAANVDSRFQTLAARFDRLEETLANKV